MDEINIIINYQAGIFSILSLGLMIAMEYAFYNNLKSFTISDSFNISKFISDENNYEVHFPNDLFNNYLDITHIYRINYELARETIKKFKLKQEIIDIALDFKNKFDINENTLGLHIRLTDMNVLHTYSKLTLDDYIKKINQVLEENPNIDNILIASDNYESIYKIISHFENINIRVNYLPDLCRSATAENSLEWTEKQIWYLENKDETIKKKFIIDSFIDMLCLSYCSYLIYRISNYANFAILYSDSLKQTYKMD